MIVPATVGPLWGSGIQPEQTSWGEKSGTKSPHYLLGERFQLLLPAILGLGNTARADILGRNVWRAPKSLHYALGE